MEKIGGSGEVIAIFVEDEIGNNKQSRQIVPHIIRQTDVKLIGNIRQAPAPNNLITPLNCLLLLITPDNPHPVPQTDLHHIHIQPQLQIINRLFLFLASSKNVQISRSVNQ